MKIFLSYRLRGEDISELEKIMKKIQGILSGNGIETFCSLFLENFFQTRGFTSQEALNYCLEKLKEYNIVLFFIKSADESEGMNAELEEAICLKKKIILFIQNDLEFPKFREAAHRVISFQDLDFVYKYLSLMTVDEVKGMFTKKTSHLIG